MISNFEFRFVFGQCAAMTFQERIDSDLKEAMKAREAQRLGVLRMLKAALKNAAIEKYGVTGQLDDAEAVAVLRKQAKQRQDSIDSFEKGGRPELAAKEKEEMEILSQYLPKQLDAGEIAKLVGEAIAEAGATFEGADGRRHEARPGEGRRAGGWQGVEPGSSEAIAVNRISPPRMVSAVIVAAGSSRRMGFDKLFATLRGQTGGRSLHGRLRAGTGDRGRSFSSPVRSR